MTALLEVTAPTTATTPRRALRSFLRHRMGLIGLAMLAVALLLAVFAPVVAPYDPYESVRVNILDIYQSPSPAHLLGTDDGGKDVLSALIYGARVSLLVGFAAAAIALVIGGLVGIVAGYRGGWIGSLLMRITDFFLVIPDLALQIVLVAIIGPSLGTIIFVIGALGWTTTARLVRSQTLTVRERKFVMRARAIGAGDAHILRRHIMPAGAAADARQHGARHQPRDPLGVDPRVPRPRGPDRHQLGPDAELRVRRGARSRPAPGGRSSRPGWRSCGSCSGRRCSGPPSRTR